MKDRFWNPHPGYQQRGSTFIIVLLVLVVVSLLGITLLTATMSNLKMTTFDRDYQAIYYIAEGGINDAVYKISKKVDELSGQNLTHDDFFEELSIYIDDYIDGVTFSNFEAHFGNQPSSIIVVEDVTTINEENSQDYTQRDVRYLLNSVGQIGVRKRSVGLTIDVSHRIDKTSEGHPVFNYSLFSANNPLTLPNQSNIDGSIYSKDINLASAGTNINGNIVSETFVRIVGNSSHPEVKGNVCALNGFVEVASGGGLSTVYGDVNASGYVTIGSAGTVNGNVFSGDDVRLMAASAKVLGNLHASGDVTLESGTFVKQHVFSGGNVRLLNSSSRVNGNVHAGGNINKGGNTYIDGSSWAGGTTNQHNPLSVNQLVPPRIQPTSPSFCITEPIQSTPVFKSFTIGAEDVALLPNWQNSQPQTVLPGSYKDLFINGNNTVRLISGNYYFNNINANSWGIKIQLDLSNGPINVYTKQNVTFGGGVKVGISKDGNNFVDMEALIDNDINMAIELAGKVYWEIHNNFSIGNSHWFGSVLVDNDFTGGSAVRLIGAYAVNKGKINLGNNPVVIYAPPTNSSAGEGSGGEGGIPGSGAGQNTIPLEGRLKISTPVKEK